MTTRRRWWGLMVTALLAGCATAPTAAPPTLGPVTQATIAPSPSTVPTEAPSPSPTAEAPSPTSDLVPADLDGVLTTPELAHRLPLAVSIDDAQVARPQSGFNSASVVWQVPVDGYESRYLLVFQENDASEIGPVRSARYFLAHWTAELRGALAHYGGDRITRAWMEANRGKLFTDIDGLGAGNPAYHRIHSRVAPHNAYTSTKDLWRVAQRLGADATISKSVHLRPFRDDTPAAERPAEQEFKIPYNTVTVRYLYVPGSNQYLRYTNGKPNIDATDGSRVTARTVVVLFMKFRTDRTIEPGHNRPVLGFTGSGVAWIYSEGRLVKGRWSKPREGDPTLILGPDGTELPFVRGRIFMQVVPLGTNVG